MADIASGQDADIISPIGQKTMAASVAVVIASDQTAFPVSSKSALTASSPTAHTAGVASAVALASNANRKGLTLVNTSVNTISIAFGTAAVLNSGITLTAGGGAFVMDEFTFTTAEVRDIASAASSNLAIQEFV